MSSSFQMQWSKPVIEPIDEPVDFDDFQATSSYENDDYVLLYDVTNSLNKKITVANLIPSTSGLVGSINDADITGDDMLVAASSTIFGKVATKTYGRSLLNASGLLEGRSLLGLTVGTDVQAYNTTLNALATSGASAVDNDIYYDSGALSRITLTPYTRDTLLTVANALATSLGVAENNIYI